MLMVLYFVAATALVLWGSSLRLVVQGAVSQDLETAGAKLVVGLTGCIFFGVILGLSQRSCLNAVRAPCFEPTS